MTTTTQAVMNVVSWLQEDWTHVIVAASAVAALTPTPKPGTMLSKAYRLLDLLALNILHAKSTGVSNTVAISAEVAQALSAKLSANVAQTQESQK